MSPRLTAPSVFRASLSISALILSAGAAFGQVGSQGHALDANLHATDGRINQAGPRIEDQIKINNAIITGNAANGRSFQGFVGYRATDDFGSRLGSNDLYNFRRDSAMSGISGLNIRASDALRYQFALSTGQAVPSYVASGIAVTDRSGTSTPLSAAAGSTTAGALRSTSEYLTGQSVRPALVGSRTDDQGYEFTAKASPLMGINWVRSANPVLRIDRPEDKLAADDLGSSGKPKTTPDGQSIDENRTVPGATGAEPGSSNVPSPLDRESMLRPSKGPPLKLEAVSPVYAQVMDSLREGFGPGNQPSTSGLIPNKIEPTDKNAKEPAGADKANTDNSLDAQLAHLRQRLHTTPSQQTGTWKPQVAQKAAAEEEPRLGQTTPIDDLLKSKPQAKNGSGTNSRVQPTDAAQARTDAPLHSTIGPEATEPEKLSAVEEITPELSRALRNTGSIRVERLSRLETISKPVANLPLYHSAMEAGQDLFTKQQYFDAEDRFTRALAAMPGDPMAKVGRAHAQLCAGLYLSAASNLRSLFADHPELIGTRYADALMPPADRAEHIITQLREEMGRGSSGLGRDASFLLAYLGHLRNDDKLVTDGLSEMRRRFGPDDQADQTLLALCRAAWTK